MIHPDFGRLLAIKWFAPSLNYPSVVEIAKATEIAPYRWQEVLDGQALLNADMAIELAHRWDLPSDFFPKLQDLYMRGRT